MKPRAPAGSSRRKVVKGTRAAKATAPAGTSKATTAKRPKKRLPEAGTATSEALGRALAASPEAEVTSGAVTVSETDYTVSLRYRSGNGILDIQLTTDDRQFYPIAQRWRYVVANRRRITRSSVDSLSRDIASWMSDVCDIEDDSFEDRVKAMAVADVVEVRIPYEKETIGWAARIFPWEHVINLLTRPYRNEDAPPTVIRQLSMVGAPIAPARHEPLLVVRSGPGEIGRRYELDHECQVVVDTLRPVASPTTETILRDPDRQTLADRVTATSPAIIHLAGVDPYALEPISNITVDPENTDGFVLRQTGSVYDVVRPADLADLVTGGTPRPTLVALTSCFGASRAAALAVARGSRHAIGFVDLVTDADALLFFGCFYRAWQRDWNLLEAFVLARNEWRAQSGSAGTGVVLWSAGSLIEVEAALTNETAPATRLQDVTPVVPPGEPTRATVHDLRLFVSLNPDRGPVGVRETMGETTTSLNYSLLHNDRTPFKTFLVEKLVAGKLPPLQIEVALEVGDELCRCKFSEELPDGCVPVEFAKRIRLPLVAGLLRHCTESLRTNLYIKVSCGDRLLEESSRRVTVLPADEWRDDGEDHRWLPSFVLPRDPAVLKVIDAAQRYLRTLLDDCAAGFDGYQRLDADDVNAADIVDPQVQAIWAALQHDLPINYINPPPSYTSQSQRLRSPSEIFRGRAATCIDLALLFGSCLEFVGIYPVVFLIAGHAFPGYWRSDKAWWRMTQFRFPDAAATGDPVPEPRPEASTTGQSEAWMFNGVDNLSELLRYVQDGTLVPFESTFVSAQRGFMQSLEEGASRLHPDTFDAMIDIQSARAWHVTPLPLFDKFS